MLQSILNTVFGCSHSRTTFPLTPARRNAGFPAQQRHGTYVVCLDCGREFRYDWSEMRVGDPVPILIPTPAAQPSFR
jgi:hypothetical protein